MNNKIESYVKSLFKNVPPTKKAIELQNEISSNLLARYEDLIKEGKSESESFGLAVASMGDIDELIKEIMPDDVYNTERKHYLERNGKLSAGSMFFMIMAPALLIFFTTVIDSDGVVGVSVFLLCIAIGIALKIYSDSSTPSEFKEEKKIKNSRFKKIDSLIGYITILVYFFVSFTTHAWHITWLIFFIGNIVSRIIGLSINEADDE